MPFFYLSHGAVLGHVQEPPHTEVHGFPAHIVPPKTYKYTKDYYFKCILRSTCCFYVMKYLILSSRERRVTCRPVDERGSPGLLAHKVSEEVVVEVAPRCGRQLAHHAAVVGPLHLHRSAVTTQHSALTVLIMALIYSEV